jgi:hypothetical protein
MDEFATLASNSDTDRHRSRRSGDLRDQAAERIRELAEDRPGPDTEQLSIRVDQRQFDGDRPNVDTESAAHKRLEERCFVRGGNSTPADLQSSVQQHMRSRRRWNEKDALHSVVSTVRALAATASSLMPRPVTNLPTPYWHQLKLIDDAAHTRNRVDDLQKRSSLRLVLDLALEGHSTALDIGSHSAASATLQSLADRLQ